MKGAQRIRALYEQLRKQVFYMIPEKWDSIYLYASVFEIVKNDPVGEMFFYYYPKGIIKKNPVNVYEVPSRFNIEEESYLKLATKLYETIKEIYLVYKQEENQRLWTNVTIKIENARFTVEYDYEPIVSNEKENQKRRIIWIYENLNFPLESFNKQEKKIIQEYLAYRKIMPKDVHVDTEGIYQNARNTHNVVSFDYEDQEKERLRLGEKRQKELEEELNHIEDEAVKPRKRNQILN